MLEVSFPNGMSSGSMNSWVWAFWLGRYRGSFCLGRDIGVVSMVLTLGWGVRGLLVCSLILVLVTLCWVCLQAGDIVISLLINTII